MIQRLIINKAYSTEPTFGTYEDTQRYSHIEKLNTTPYPFYFVGQPMSEDPVVYSRCAGWSPELLYLPKRVESDPYPKHCFQAACNTQYTKVGSISAASDKNSKCEPCSGGAKETTKSTSKKQSSATGLSSTEPCSQQKCINLFR